MRAHAERIGMPCPPERVIATGGGSANKHLLNMIASIFGCNVYTAQRPGNYLSSSRVYKVSPGNNYSVYYV